MKAVNYKKNGGKGYAVRTGMKYTEGKFTLMLDADGATDVNEIENFLNLARKKSNSNDFIFIGSRSQVEKTLQDRPWYRRIPSIVNNIIVKYILGVRKIKDTQCGFKLFSKKCGKELFSKMHLNRWAFDVELLILAQKNKVEVSEIAVEWQEMDGGNLFVLQATISFFRDYIGLFFFYLFGVWKY